MKINHLIASLSILMGVVLFFTSPPDDIAPVVMRTAGVVIIAVSLFATAVIPEFLGGLIFFFLCVILTIAPPNIVFSGFFSGAVWLVLGGMIIGIGIEVSGLGTRLAGKLERVFGGSYFKLICGTVLLMLVLAFLVPSAVGRVTIMLPVVLALAGRLGFKEGSNGRAGLILSVGMGTLITPFSILPANVPNVVLSGAAEAVHGIQFSYTDWLLLHFPVLGVIGFIGLPIAIYFLFPDKIEKRLIKEPEVLQPWSFNEKKLLVLLFITLGLWATDNLHGISPAWVSLGAGIVCSLPVIGVLPAGQVISKINFGPIIFLASVIGMGAVVTQTGLGESLAHFLISKVDLTEGAGLKKFYSVIGLGWFLQLFTTLPGQPAIMTAVSEPIALATGWSLPTVLMAQVPTWIMVIFPYQAPVLVVTRVISGLAISKFMKLMIPFAIFGALVSIPLQYYWWKYLGYLQS